MSDTTESPAGDDLIRRIEDGICWITLNRPDAGNAMTQFMRDQIAEWVRDASSDLFVRVVVITAAGDKAFCSGADLRGGQLPPRPKPEDAPENVVGEAARMIRDGWQAWSPPSSTARSRSSPASTARRPAAACTSPSPATSS